MRPSEHRHPLLDRRQCIVDGRERGSHGVRSPSANCGAAFVVVNVDHHGRVQRYTDAC